MFSKQRIIYFLSYVTAFVVALKQLREPDIWWQLLSGRWMLQNHCITHSDPFSYTMQGKPWINVKWLYEILIAGIENFAGPFGLILLQAAVNLLLVYLLISTMQALQKHFNKSIPLFAQTLALVLFLAVVEYRMAGRPEMFSHLFSALFIYILTRSSRYSFRSLFYLIPLQCLWANMHEGYPVGIVIIGTFMVAALINSFTVKDQLGYKGAARLALILLLSILAILINPNGILLWKQPFEIYRQVFVNKYTNELFNVFNAQYFTFQATLHLVLLVLVAVYWLVYLVKGIKQKAAYLPYTLIQLLLIVLFAYLSLTANRNIPFAQIVLFPSVPFLLSDLWQLFAARFKSLALQLGKTAFIATLVLLTLAYYTIVSNKYYKFTQSPNRYGIHLSYFHNPFGAARFIKEKQIGGTAFSDYFISSYLLYDLYPSFKSYIDLRDLDVFPTTFFDNYFDLYTHKEKFKQLDSIYQFNYIVLSTSQLISLQQELYWLPGYNMIYVDPVAAIFLKQNDRNRYLNANIDIQKPFTWPQLPDEPGWTYTLSKLFNPWYANPGEDEKYAPVYEALFNKQMRNYPDAVQALKPKLSNYENEALPLLTLAQIYKEYADVTKEEALKQKRLDSANAYIQEAEQYK